MCAYQGVDQVRARTDIKHGGLFWHHAAIVIRQQIGKMMDVIRTSWHRWAEKAIWDVPVRNAIKMGQQRFVQRLNRQRIGKVYRRFTGWCLNKEDLCVAKLCALREKDRNFVAALVDAGLVDPDIVLDRLDTVEPAHTRAASSGRLWLTALRSRPDNPPRRP